MPVRILFLGSKPVGYRCLQYLISQQSLLDIEITGLLTKFRKEFNNEYDLKAVADKHHIPLINSLDELPDCDLLVAVEYHEILKMRHIRKASRIAVNLHLAPLPE